MVLSHAAPPGSLITFTYTLTDATGKDVVQQTTAEVDNTGKAALLSVATVDDALYENNESFKVHVDGVTLDGNPVFEHLNLNDATQETIITDDRGTDADDTVTVNMTGDALVNEGSEASYSITLDKAAPPGSKVLLTYSYPSGGAEKSDITEMAEAVINADGKTATFKVVANIDNVYEGAQAFTVSVNGVVQADGTTPAFEKVISSAASISTTIMDEGDKPEVESLVADNDGQVTEGGTAGWTLSMSNPSTTPTTITLNIATGESATQGADYATSFKVYDADGELMATVPANSPTFILPAGEDTVRVELDTIDDAYIENNETLTLQARTSDQTGWTAANTATTIVDDLGNDAADTVTVTLSGDTSVIEGETANYTVDLSHPVPAGTKILLKYSYKDAGGSDITAQTEAIVQNSGSTATFSVSTVNDTHLDRDESFTVRVDGIVDGNDSAVFEYMNLAKASVTTAIEDNEGSVQVTSLTRLQDGNENGDSWPGWTLNVNNAADSPTTLTLQFDDSQQATFGEDFTGVLHIYTGQAGDPQMVTITDPSQPVTWDLPENLSSVRVYAQPKDDALYEGNESIILNAKVDGTNLTGWSQKRRI
ncbi:hypothetical protein CS022_04975 [Veronia nyctiphanis]|uniref:Uncharacterized protein n=1 Tax=Veronia nyctiphanis TaxID=1278244 RepID=A0A4Q0YS19_9GAMM|nr:immunoglobulin-like domain-containing protein [Veronia nyctiphanis]RXJ74007.1 hypothetical protein CS022_04975 [Veronia nyctiphanis]